jgi:hypothetical protein
MSKEIDELFSSERLRKNWKRPAPARDAPRQKKEKGPGDALEFLRLSINNRFSGDDLFALNILVDELASLLDLLDNPDSSAAQIAPAVHETLSQLEDLLESLELRDRTEPASR